MDAVLTARIESIFMRTLLEDFWLYLKTDRVELSTEKWKWVWFITLRNGS